MRETAQPPKELENVINRAARALAGACRAAPLAATVLCLRAPATPYADAPAAGSVHFMRGAESAFDAFSSHPTSAEQQWMRDHYARMRTYAPYFDSRLAWFPDAWTYKDTYAIYPDSPLASGQDGVILREADGRRLYIPWGCSGGTCPQYAGDIGDPGFRAAWIDEARTQMAAGYEGLYLDDVNMFMQVSDGTGTHVAPIDPRTGEAMTWPAWKGYMADFVTEVRTAFPDVEIIHNAIWFAGDSDPDIARQLRAADYIVLERGINDSGLTGGTGRFALRRLVDYVDHRHAEGHAVVFDSEAPTEAARLYGLAGYFLVSGGRDLLGSFTGGLPSDWWAGYDTTLGAPAGPRYDFEGVIRRDFAGGVVLLNPPGAAIRTVAVGAGLHDLTGAPASSVTLDAASGAVLLADAPAPKLAPSQTETAIPSPSPVPEPTPSPAPTVP